MQSLLKGTMLHAITHHLYLSVNDFLLRGGMSAEFSGTLGVGLHQTEQDSGVRRSWVLATCHCDCHNNRTL